MLLHPYIVHFAIILLAVGVVCDFLFIIGKKEKYWKYANYLLISGTIASIIAVFTGNQAYDILEIPIDVKSLVWNHRDSGELTMWIFISIAAMRLIFIKLSLFKKPLKWIYYVLLLTGFVFLLRTGIMGGEMTYIHGIGVDQTEKPLPAKPSFED